MRKFILGTDWWTDCDDAVALRLIARAIKNGKAELAGIIINACMEYSVASLKGFLTAEGIDPKSIPIGIDLAATDFGGKPPYQKRLKEDHYPEGSNDEAEDPVRLYRRLLAQAEEPLEIIEIGYLQVMAELIKSGTDDISEKSGAELMKEKVKKLWVMAGKWDKDGEKENNFCRNERSRAAGEEFCRLCSVEVTFLGWEVGFDVITGSRLKEDDVIHKVLCDHGSKNGRSSWDPMLVLMALIGDEEQAGYNTVRGKARVDRESGQNFFAPDENGLHRYAEKKYENSYYENMIDELIK